MPIPKPLIPTPALFRPQQSPLDLFSITSKYRAVVEGVNRAEDDYRNIQSTINSLHQQRVSNGELTAMCHLLLSGNFTLNRTVTVPAFFIIEGLPNHKITKMPFTDESQDNGVFANDTLDASGYDGNRNIIFKNLNIEFTATSNRGTAIFSGHMRQVQVINCTIINNSSFTSGQAVEINSTLHALVRNNRVSMRHSNNTTSETLAYDSAVSGSAVNILNKTFNDDFTIARSVFFSENLILKGNYGVSTQRAFSGSNIYSYMNKMLGVSIAGVLVRADTQICANYIQQEQTDTLTYTGSKAGIHGVNDSLYYVFIANNNIIKNFTRQVSTENLNGVNPLKIHNNTYSNVLTDTLHVPYSISVSDAISGVLTNNYFRRASAAPARTQISITGSTHSHTITNNIIDNVIETSGNIIDRGGVSYNYVNNIMIAPSSVAFGAFINNSDNTRLAFTQIHPLLRGTSETRNYFGLLRRVGTGSAQTSVSIYTTLNRLSSMVQSAGARSAITSFDIGVANQANASVTANSGAVYFLRGTHTN